MNNLINPISRSNGLVVHEMPGEILVYDLDSNKAHCLNETVAFVWKYCDGNNSIADIMLEFESNGHGKVTEDFIWLALDQLKENGLLSSSVAPRFQNQSRREILKTIGLTSMAALPFIASIVAPSNALASVSACVCTSNAQCLLPRCNSTNCSPAGICV